MSQATGGPSPREMLKRTENGSDFDEETQKALEEINSCQNEIETLNEKFSEEILKETIPNFWVTAMANHPQFSLLTDEDDCLHFLTKLEVEEFEDIKSGYRIKLFFEENPFFDNNVLVKEFHMGSPGDPKSTSTEIKWKENMDLSKKQKEVIQIRRKRGLEAKTFFTWYVSHEGPSADDIAEMIKDYLWPNPLQYYSVPDLDNENGLDDEDDSDEDEDDEIRDDEIGDDHKGVWGVLFLKTYCIVTDGESRGAVGQIIHRFTNQRTIQLFRYANNKSTTKVIFCRTPTIRRLPAVSLRSVDIIKEDRDKIWIAKKELVLD